MTRADVHVIFGNIEELAVFTDRLVGLLEKAMGDSVDSGTSDDRVGALFLEIVRHPPPLSLAPT